MGRKSVIKHHKMLDNVTINANQTSDKTNVEPIDQGTLEIVWSSGASPVGNVTIEASNSSEVEFTEGTESWIVLDVGGSIDISGASGDHQVLFNSMPFRYFRVKYNYTSGSAILSITFHAKTVGA